MFHFNQPPPPILYGILAAPPPPPPLHHQIYPSPPPPHFLLAPPPAPPPQSTVQQPQQLERSVASHLDPCALHVRNVSVRWPSARFVGLLRQLHATAVHEVPAARQRRRRTNNNVRSFVVHFETAARAFDVLWYLHQRNCGGRVLSVQYATRKKAAQRPAEEEEEEEIGAESSAAAAEEVDDVLDAKWRESAIRAIGDAMRKHPRLFGAIVRLMRRMQVPVDERGGDGEKAEKDRNDEERPKSQPQPVIECNELLNVVDADDSDSESEMEDDTEDETTAKNRHSHSQTTILPGKRVQNHGPLLLPTPAKRLRLMMQQQQQKKSGEIATWNRTPAAAPRAIQIIAPIQLPLAKPSSAETQQKSAPAAAGTAPEAIQERLSAAEMAAHPLFQHGTIGAPPGRRLYVKNLPRSATVARLEQLFGSDLADTTCRCAVQLFTSGRLKGQAFVTFLRNNDDAADGGEPEDATATATGDDDDVELVRLASAAVTQNNGLLLDGRPIVVAFGRRRRT